MPNLDPDLMEASQCRGHDPCRSLHLCDRYLSLHPGDPDGLFTRHQTLMSLGEFPRALDDINAALACEADAVSYSARALVYRELNDHKRAIEDLTRAQQLDDEKWLAPLDVMLRADSLARLGYLDEALADCTQIPEDHYAPAFYGLPGGDKHQFIEQIRSRALAVRAARK